MQQKFSNKHTPWKMNNRNSNKPDLEWYLLPSLKKLKKCKKTSRNLFYKYLRNNNYKKWNKKKIKIWKNKNLKKKIVKEPRNNNKILLEDVMTFPLMKSKMDSSKKMMNRKKKIMQAKKVRKSNKIYYNKQMKNKKRVIIMSTKRITIKTI